MGQIFKPKNESSGFMLRTHRPQYHLDWNANVFVSNFIIKGRYFTDIHFHIPCPNLNRSLEPHFCGREVLVRSTKSLSSKLTSVT